MNTRSRPWLYQRLVYRPDPCTTEPVVLRYSLILVLIVGPGISFWHIQRASANSDGIGACCAQDGTCSEISEASCLAAEGLYHGDGTVCAPPTTIGIDCSVGACCLPTGTCTDGVTFEECTGCTSENCGGFQGVYLGNGTVCAQQMCPDPLPGACCLPDGSCVDGVIFAECLLLEGSFQGETSLCDFAGCLGSCCLADQSCVDDQSELECQALGGNYQGEDTFCESVDCTVGACCLANDQCLELAELACEFEFGEFQGQESDCSYTDCASCLDGGAADSCAVTETGKLISFDLESGHALGTSVAISQAGDTTVVGAPFGDDDAQLVSGAAYVYSYGDLSCGVVELKLDAAEVSAEDRFGNGVDISADGEVVVVGAYQDGSGSAYVFVRAQGGEGNWGQVARLSTTDSASDGFGYAVAIDGDGDTIVVGAPFADEGAEDAGSVFIYHRPESGGWVDMDAATRKIFGSDSEYEDRFGIAVDIRDDGMLVVVGSTHGDANSPNHDAGAAYVFGRDAGGPNQYGQLAKLTISDANENVKDLTTPVSISGNKILLGAPFDNAQCPSSECLSGAAYLYYEPQPGGWVDKIEDYRITPCDQEAFDKFGTSVSLLGDVALIGAPTAGDETGTGGAAYVFSFDGLLWHEEAKLTASDQSLTNELGYSVALSANDAIVGAPGDSAVGMESGAAYVFEGMGDCNGTGTRDACDLLAGISQDCGAIPNDCCTSKGQPGCSVPEIEECVCLVIPSCCSVAWGQACVEELENSGCGSCCSDGNGILDECENCLGDLDGDGDVDVLDLIALLANWGMCSGCNADINANCEVDVGDLLHILFDWGDCAI